MVEILIEFIKASMRWFAQEAKIETRARLQAGGVITPFNWDFTEDGSNHAPYGIVSLFMEYYDRGTQQWRKFMNLQHTFDAEKEGTEKYDRQVIEFTSKLMTQIAVAGVWQYFVAVKAQEKKSKNIITDLSLN